MHNDQLSTEIIEYFQQTRIICTKRSAYVIAKFAIRGKWSGEKLHATSINKLSGDKSILFHQKVKSKVKVYVSKVVRTLRTK